MKKNIPQSNEKWVDIIGYDRYASNQNELHFRVVEYGLYKRTIKPEYPPKSEFIVNGEFDEKKYYIAIRAITWEVANLDILEQKEKGIVGEKYQITGVKYDKNEGQYRSTPPWLNPNSTFYGITPGLTQSRAYGSQPEWVYEIKSIKKLD